MVTMKTTQVVIMSMKVRPPARSLGPAELRKFLAKLAETDPGDTSEIKVRKRWGGIRSITAVTNIR